MWKPADQEVTNNLVQQFDTVSSREGLNTPKKNTGDEVSEEKTEGLHLNPFGGNGSARTFVLQGLTPFNYNVNITEEPSHKAAIEEGQGDATEEAENVDSAQVEKVEATKEEMGGNASD